MTKGVTIEELAKTHESYSSCHKKKMKDVTFKEFNTWANKRACDGQWSMKTAMTAITCITEVNRHISKEKYWNEIKGEFFNLEAEIEVDE